MAAPQRKRIRPVGKVEPEECRPAGFQGLEEYGVQEPVAHHSLEATPEQLQAEDAVMHADFTDALAFDLVIPDEANNPQHAKWMQKADDDILEAVESIGGRYFKIHDQYNGMPVFRQENNLDGSPNGLFLFFEPVMEGWVMVKSMLDATEDTYVAWGRPSDGHMGPRKMHLPFWSSLHCPLVRTVSIGR